MGEIAEMMLDGTLCEGCGEYMDDDGASGFPRYCSPECARGRGMDYIAPEARNKFACPSCQKRFRSERAMRQHFGDKHGAATAP